MQPKPSQIFEDFLRLNWVGTWFADLSNQFIAIWCTHQTLCKGNRPVFSFLPIKLCFSLPDLNLMLKWSKACFLFLFLYLDLNSQTWLWLHSYRNWLETIRCFWVLELKTAINDIDYVRLCFLKGPSSVRRRSVTVSKAALQKLPRANIGFPERVDTHLN